MSSNEHGSHKFAEIANKRQYLIFSQHWYTLLKAAV